MTKSTRAGRPQIRGEERRRRLKVAALELLSEHKFKDISYQTLAAKAGLPLASCYHFFANKLDLVRSVADDLTEEYTAAVLNSSLYQQNNAWEDIISSWIDATVSHHSRSAAELQIFFGGDIPLPIRKDSLEREKIISDRLWELIKEKASCGELANSQRVLFYGVEIGRTVLALDYQEHKTITPFGAKNAKLATIAYLKNYLD